MCCCNLSFPLRRHKKELTGEKEVRIRTTFDLHDFFTNQTFPRFSTKKRAKFWFLKDSCRSKSFCNELCKTIITFSFQFKLRTLKVLPQKQTKKFDLSQNFPCVKTYFYFEPENIIDKILCRDICLEFFSFTEIVLIC